MATRALSVDTMPQAGMLFAEWNGLTAGDDGAMFIADGWQLVGVVWSGTLGTLPSLQVQTANDQPPSLFTTITALTSAVLGLLSPASNPFPMWGRAFKPNCSAGVGTNVTCNMIFRRA